MNETSARNLTLKRTVQFLGILALTLLALEFCARLIISFYQPDEGLPLAIRKKYLIIEGKHLRDSNSIVAFLGNSLIYMNVYPELMSARFRQNGIPIDTVSLAAPSASPGIEASLLNALVKKGAHPKLAIYNVSPWQMVTHAKNFKLDTPFYNSYLYQCEISKPKQWGKTLACQLKKTFYIDRYRSFFKSLLVEELFDRLSKPEKMNWNDHWQREEYVHAEISNAGWGPSYKIVPDEKTLLSFREKRNFEFSEPAENAESGAASLHPLARPDFMPVVDVCRKNNIPLVLLIPPSYYKLNDPKQADTRVHLMKLLNRFAQSQPDLYVIDLAFTDHNILHYYDDAHQNAYGAVDTTNQIAEVLLPVYQHLILETKTENK